jgi:RNA polymerase sigma-70 factor (ECF subfamily)
MDQVASFASALPKLRTMALKLCCNPEDAEDLLQETILKAIRFQDKFDGKHEVAWLKKILYNSFVNNYRKQTRQEEGHNLYQKETPKEIPPPRLNHLTEEAILGIMRQALPPEFLDTFYKRAIENKSYREIAAETDTPVGTVMSRLYRARRILQNAIKDINRELGYE